MEDTKILRLLQKDPNTGMEKLMDEYAGLIYAVVRGKLAGSSHLAQEAEDCVAEVFSQFYLSLKQFDPKKASIKTYLCVLARNNATDLLRRRANQPDHLSMDDQDNFLHLVGDSAPEAQLEEAELRRAVQQAVLALDEPDRSILFRKFYYGQSSQEIARALGLTVSNVDTRTHRALQKLRNLFGGNVT